MAELPRAGARTALLLVLLAAGLTRAGAASAPPSTRIEARSSDLVTVGVVHGDRMSIHISRLEDNAPVRDAVVAVLLRGASHPAVAEADGSYTLANADLKLAGAAAVEFHITQGGHQETLKGTLDVPAAAAPAEDKSQARQYAWWALNFGVCIGFLALISRRKKKQDP